MCPSAVSEVEPYASRGARTVPGGVPPVREAPTRQGYNRPRDNPNLPRIGGSCKASNPHQSSFSGVSARAVVRNPSLGAGGSGCPRKGPRKATLVPGPVAGFLTGGQTTPAT